MPRTKSMSRTSKCPEPKPCPKPEKPPPCPRPPPPPKCPEQKCAPCPQPKKEGKCPAPEKCPPAADCPKCYDVGYVKFLLLRVNQHQNLIKNNTPYKFIETKLVKQDIPEKPRQP